MVSKLSLNVSALAVAFAFGFALVAAEVFTSVSDLKRVVNFGKDLRESIPEGPMRSSNFYTELSKQLPCLFDVHGRVSLEPISILRMVSLFAKALNATTGESPELREFITQQAASLKLELPGDVDVAGAVNAIIRLQMVHNVTAVDLTQRGFQSTFKLDSIETAAELPAGCADALILNAQDCALIANKLTDFNDTIYFNMSKVWMKRAIDISLNGGRVALLDAARQHAESEGAGANFVGKSMFELVTTADQDPTFDFASAVNDFLRVEESSIFNLLNNPWNFTEMDVSYECRKLCRESIIEPVNPITINSALKCTYDSLGHAYYLIGPVKTEWVTVDSMWMRIYYDVLSDAEILRLKEIGAPMFHRSGVIGAYQSERRISKTAWLGRFNTTDDLNFIAKFNARSNHLAHMNELGAEFPQLVQYGLGGHFWAHIDPYTRFGTFWNNTMGGRIATLMYYLSDVEAGGSTVFPQIGVAIRPKKGSAVLWYNLLLNGELINVSRHAGCPVVSGEKWVLNKWYNYFGQFNTHPCSTDPNL